MATMNSPETTEATPGVATTFPDDDTDLVEEELLVEEISIDGMCGVY
jgi:mycofactocin precursor